MENMNDLASFALFWSILAIFFSGVAAVCEAVANKLYRE